MINSTLRKFEDLQRELETEGYDDFWIDELVKIKEIYRVSK